MMSDITNPLRLAVGSHAAGSGKGCAMNVVSWENGDRTITDFPKCTDQLMTRLVQRLNDQFCTHRDGDLLCAPCSVTVLAVAHRVAGTGFLGLSDARRAAVYTAIAKDQASAAASASDAASYASDAAASAASYAAASYAASAASYAAASAASYAASAASYAAASAASYAASAASAASYAASDAASDAYLTQVERAIALFGELTGYIAIAPDEKTVSAACVLMLATT
jgi:hypothetical protein